MTTETPIRCLVVDDEPLAAALLASYVRRTPFLELAGEYNESEQALARITAGDIELVFLDIHMPGLDGVSLARKVPEGTRVVFTTAYSDHALDGFDVNALHYLLKPVSYDEFVDAASRARAARDMRSQARVAETPSGPEFLTVKSEYRVVRIPVADIDFVEGLKDYVKIYSNGGERPVLTLMSMKTAEELLPAPNFMRIHRSFIVNLDKVRVVERNCILMNGRAIPVSDSCRRRFAAAIGLE